MLSKPWATDPRLARAQGHAQRGEALQADLLYRQVLADHPDCFPAAHALGWLAFDRDDLDAAVDQMRRAHALAPDDADIEFDLTQTLWAAGRSADAVAQAQALTTRAPNHSLAWLALGDMLEATGDAPGALRARFLGLTRAQKNGRWLGPETTEPALVDMVTKQMQAVRVARREHLMASMDALRSAHGRSELARVERALTGYLGEWDATPPDPRQRPKFFYFPDLPPGPYHNPYLHEWADRLQAGWREIRDEAAALLHDDQDFVDFLGLAPGASKKGFVGGTNPNAAWDAFFFYRHGQRHDANHLKCPRTSQLLDSIELCRVARQAPEVCFSVIRPQSTIEAHHGVTNTRLVMHLPLIVPADCALSIIDGDAHAWREGELMMFDDTYQHAAWNRSDSPRLILLMDCWNPHLTPVEREAVMVLVEAIDRLEN